MSPFTTRPASLATLHDRIRANLRDLDMDESAASRVSGWPVLEDAVVDVDFVVEAAVWREAVALVAGSACASAVASPCSDRWRTPIWSARPHRRHHDIVLPSPERGETASPYLAALVHDGKLGIKSGEGFRTWTREQQAALRARVVQHLRQALLAGKELT